MQEFEAIARYFKPLANSAGAMGLSDDVARLSAGGDKTIVTVDCLVEGVHFLPEDPIDTVARKLVRVNVSDIHAKGALPQEALLVLGWPEGRPDSDLEIFAAALGEELPAWNIALIGGDTVSTPGPLFLSLTVTGQCLDVGPVARAGAIPGDELWVTGTIGAGWCGLKDARAGKHSPFASHYREPALPGEGAARLVAKYASAAMDVSDGLLGDAAKLAEASEVGIEIDQESVPLARPKSSIMDQLTGGDDYQILFTASAPAAAMIEAEASESGIKLTRIGRISVGSGLMLLSRGKPRKLPENLGFAHN